MCRPDALSAGEVAAVWPVVHAEREALLADLAPLTAADWRTPSLCNAWTVHDVLAHIVETAKTTRANFFWHFARARFDFDRYTAQGLARERCPRPEDTCARLQAVVDRTTGPPAPLDSRLVEIIVHGEDIRRPLGITRAYPRAAVVAALRLQTRVAAAFGGGRELTDDLELAATDTSASVGSGASVRGPALSLLLVASGRRIALPDLSGPGVELLADRLDRAA